MPANHWSDVRRLLIACPGGPHVLAHAGPALQYLQRALPAAARSLWMPSSEPGAGTKQFDFEELLLSPPAWTATLRPLINGIQNRAFDGAVIFTDRNESPYAAAYVCYLAGIPLRLGQSREFGGSVLSDWVRPQENVDSLEQHHLHLIEAGELSAIPRET